MVEQGRQDHTKGGGLHLEALMLLLHRLLLLHLRRRVPRTVMLETVIHRALSPLADITHDLVL